jgi:antitoxin MazE
MPVIRKWGNSLALRIPAGLASQLNLSENSTVECTVLNGQLLVKPVERGPRFVLRDLISAINAENTHKEVETGDAVGVEIW